MLTEAKEKIIRGNWQKIITGEKVIMSDHDMDLMQAMFGNTKDYDHLRSIINPERLGILDHYVVWID